MSLPSTEASSRSSGTCSVRNHLAKTLLMPALLALACATEAPPKSVGRADLDQALSAAAASPERGVARLEALRQEDPQGPLAGEISLAIAQIHSRAGNAALAAAALEAGLAAQPSGNRSDEIRLELARIEADRGRRETAYRVLSPVRLKNLTPAQRRAALALLAKLAHARRDYVAQIVWLSKARAEAPDDDAAALIDVEIDERLSELSRPELEQVAEKLRGAVPAGRARIREAELALRLGQIDAASQALAQAASLALTQADAARLARVEAQLVRKGGKLARDAQRPAPAAAQEAAPAATTATLGVVLPLSGRFAKFGEESLSGVLLATAIFGDEPPPGTPQVRLVIRDSGGGAAEASAAVAELAADPSVTAVLGPLLGDECEAAATAAESAGLPLLVLSGKASPAAPAAHVYRFGATAHAEVDALAEYAVKVQGMKRFGILYPEDAYGKGLRDLFQQAVQARGATTADSAGYEPRARDLSAPVRQLLGQPARPGAAPRLDAIFVPDARDKGVQAAQALAAAGANNVRLLGMRGWQSPDLLRLGGAAVEGAIFSEPFDPASSSPTVAEFVRRYHLSHGRSPDIMAAQAFDAARVLLAALPPGEASRAELEERLRRVRGYPGASGTITLEADGSVQKTPALRGVRNGRIVELQ